MLKRIQGWGWGVALFVKYKASLSQAEIDADSIHYVVLTQLGQIDPQFVHYIFKCIISNANITISLQIADLLWRIFIKRTRRKSL